MSSIAVHGHRGARAAFPENTMAAFLHAIEAGADFLELDVLVTRDGVPVVCHDPILNPRLTTAPPGSCVRELTLAELRRWDFGASTQRRFPRQRAAPGSRIVTLEEVLDLACRAPIGFNIEVKSFPENPAWAPPPAAFARLLVEPIQRRGLEQRVIVQSFDLRILKAVKRLLPAIRLAALYQLGLLDPVAVARAAGVSIVAPNHRLLTAARVRAAHQAGLHVIAWTANRPRDWDRLIRAGVDGIITDDPQGLIAHLRARGLR